MNEQEAGKLRIDDSVFWDDDMDQAGVVTKVTETAVFIQWDDGTKGWIDKRDMKDVHSDFVAYEETDNEAQI